MKQQQQQLKVAIHGTPRKGAINNTTCELLLKVRPFSAGSEEHNKETFKEGKTKGTWEKEHCKEEKKEEKREKNLHLKELIWEIKKIEKRE